MGKASKRRGARQVVSGDMCAYLTAAFANAGLSRLVTVLPDGDHGVLLIADRGGPHEQQTDISFDVFETLARAGSGISPPQSAAMHLLIAINGNLAVHMAAHGRQTGSAFVAALEGYREVLLGSELLCDVPDELRVGIAVFAVAHRIGEDITARLQQAGLGDIVELDVGISDVERGEVDASIEVIANLGDVGGEDRSYSVEISLEMVLSEAAYRDFRDATDMALTILAEGLEEVAASLDQATDARLIAAIGDAVGRIVGSGMTSALSGEQQDAMRTLLAVCSQVGVDGKLAAMQGVATAERYRIPPRSFRNIEGVTESVQAILDGKHIGSDPALTLATAIGRYPPHVAGPVAGYFVADMLAAGRDPKLFRDAVTRLCRQGGSLH